MLSIYWFGRFMDMATTSLFPSYHSELNPLMKFAWEQWGFGGFLVVNVFLSWLMYLVLRRFKGGPTAMGVISLIFAGWNLYWL